MLIVKLALELQLGLPFCIYYVFTKPNSTLLMRYSYCHVGWHINRRFSNIEMHRHTYSHCHKKMAIFLEMAV